MFAQFSVVNRKLILGGKREKLVMAVTAKQKRIFDFIRGYMESNQEAPTIAEIGRKFEMRSSASVHAVLTALEREGLIKRIPNISRGIQIVERKEGEGGGDGDNEIPLVGIVAAGKPIEAILSHDTVSVPKNLQGNGRTYALRVRGDSMIEENIQDGDIIIVSAQQTAENGQIVIALIEDTYATVKKFYREPDVIRLKAANPEFQPLIITENIRIQGVVKGLIRRYAA
jgi:repressor LexA